MKTVKRNRITNLKYTVLEKDTDHMSVYADVTYATKNGIKS